MATQAPPYRDHLAPTTRGPLIPAAIFMHLGLLLVCACTVFTGWQSTIITRPQWAVTLLIAAILLIAGTVLPLALARSVLMRFALAAGALLALSLAYDPQLSAIPRLGESLPETIGSAQVGLAIVGVAIFFVAWLAWRGAGGELALGPAPFRRAAGAAAGIVTLCAVTAYLILHRPHGLPLTETLRPVLAVLQAAGLVVPLVGCIGGPGVRRAPLIILGLALLLAFVRNIALPLPE